MAATKKKTGNKPQIVKVDDYPTRTDVEVPEDVKREQVDQIPDYRDKYPTLDATGPAHDPEVQAEVLAGAQSEVEEAPAQEQKTDD